MSNGSVKRMLFLGFDFYCHDAVLQDDLFNLIRNRPAGQDNAKQSIIDIRNKLPGFLEACQGAIHEAKKRGTINIIVYEEGAIRIEDVSGRTLASNTWIRPQKPAPEVPMKICAVKLIVSALNASGEVETIELIHDIIQSGYQLNISMETKYDMFSGVAGGANPTGERDVILSFRKIS